MMVTHKSTARKYAGALFSSIGCIALFTATASKE